MYAEPLPRMTEEEYLAWEELQDEKHEFVDGRPELRSLRKWPDETEAMAGGRLRHSTISANIIGALIGRLRGGQCRALTSDIKVRSRSGRFRYPDVTVNCGRITPEMLDALVAPEPVVLFEVLSPSNRLKDLLILVEDYQAIETVQQVVFIDRRTSEIVILTRGEGGWRRDSVEGLDQVLELPSIGVSLPAAEIFDGVETEANAGR